MMDGSDLTTWILLVIAVWPLAFLADWAHRRKLRAKWGPEAISPGPLVLPGGAHAPLPCSRTVARYVKRFDRFQLADKAQLLVDGRQAYPEMLASIEAATSSVHLETYILHADHTGKRFQEALIRAARRGVEVKLVYDYIGAFGIPRQFVQAMLDAGVEVSVYHPLLLSRPLWAINRRDHRKLLIVDHRIVFTGGLNIGDDYAAPEEGGKGWRDTHVRLDGDELGAWVELLFQYAWRHATPYQVSFRPSTRLRERIRRLRRPATLRSLFGRKLPIPPSLCNDGRVPVQVIGNKEFRNRRRIHRAYIHAIQQAKRYVLIENGYFIPDTHIRRALAHAVKRGVVVAVVVAHRSDVRITEYASRALYTMLLESGVRIFEWPGAMMHAKTAVIDDAWAVVGSYNMDHRSLFHQLESVAVIADPVFARGLREQTMKDIAQCQEITLRSHELRPLHQKLLEFGAYLVRHWL